MFILLCLLSHLCLFERLVLVSNDEREQPGIVRAAPIEQPFVQLDDGTWMVPYTVTLQNTSEVTAGNGADLRPTTFIMIPVPGGRVQIGSTESEPGREPDEGPQFETDVAPFWIGRTEVTWNEYRIYQGLYSEFRQRQWDGEPVPDLLKTPDAVSAPTPVYDATYVQEFGDKVHPVISVTQYGAKQYSKWLSLKTGQQYRLPTEVEWEYACRAGSDTAYCFGNSSETLPVYAHYTSSKDAGTENAPEGTAAVASKQPNRWGLFDMHGNVAEWVIDQYSADGYLELATNNKSNPAFTFVPTQMESVLRGGGWLDSEQDLRSAARHASSESLWEYDPDLPRSVHWLASHEGRNIGFRVVRSLKPLPPSTIALFWNAQHQQLESDLLERLNSGREAIGIPQQGSP
ncbi:MAG: formylglycine-generating enzyme family protein [Planctomyces sp.]|nr:formylglycine-generating enzyme family protein [Planctomyces sp.]